MYNIANGYVFTVAHTSYVHRTHNRIVVVKFLCHHDTYSSYADVAILVSVHDGNYMWIYATTDTVCSPMWHIAQKTERGATTHACTQMNKITSPVLHPLTLSLSPAKAAFLVYKNIYFSCSCFILMHTCTHQQDGQSDRLKSNTEKLSSLILHLQSVTVGNGDNRTT